MQPKIDIAKTKNGRGIKLALLTNFVAPYRIPVFQELQRCVREFRVFVSTSMEGDRPWNPESGGLNVVLQRSFTIKSWWNRPGAFKERIYLHFPYDSLVQLIRYRPDVIVSGEFGFRTLNAVIYRNLFRRSRLVVWGTLSEETEANRSKLRVALRSTIIRFVDAIFTNGRSGVRYLENFSIPRERLFIIPQTTDIVPFLSVSIQRSPDAAYRMLYSGRLVARKQLRAFVEVLKSWCADNPARNVEMWFVGDGPDRQLLENIELISNLKLKFLGGVAYKDLPAIYAQCGALVLPTLADEWALVVNEGLAAGMPVLGSSYSQAVQDLVVDAQNGWVYRIDDFEQVKFAVEKFLTSDEQTLSAMRERARTSVSDLTPEFVAQKMLSVIEFTITSQTR